jgi:uncharacterized protein YndB with AHSA1/START domain
MSTQDPDRAIRLQIVVETGLDAVWDAWTTEGGIKTFFAPDCHVDLRVDGPYEIFFDPEAEPGQRGADEMRILAFQPKKMLAFTWNAPLHMPQVRKQLTHVVVRFQELDAERTKVSLFHDGWGEGGEWDDAFEYFVKAWRDLVLHRLQYRFSVGPVDWENLPEAK